MTTRAQTNETDREDHFHDQHPLCERCDVEVCFCSSDGCPAGISSDGFRRDDLVWCGEVCYEAAKSGTPEHVEEERTTPIPVVVGGERYVSWYAAQFWTMGGKLRKGGSR